MANIVQQPQSYNFAGNLSDIVLMSETPVTFSVPLLLEETYYPDATGRVIIPLRAFFEAHLHAPGIDDIPDEGLPLTPYTYYLDGVESGSFHVLSGGVAGTVVDTELFLRSNFLTWQPQTRRVTYHEPQWLRYVALQACTVKVKAYFADSDPVTVTLKELAGLTQYSLDMNYGRIRGLFDKQPTYYDVWVENSGGERLSFVQRYVLREEAEGTADLFVFENSLGGFDTIRFSGDRKEVGEAESRNAVFDGDTNEYGVDYSKAWLKQTGYIPDERTRVWVLEFFSSCRRYHLAAASLERIYVSKPKLEATAGEAAGYEFTFAYSHQSRYLNIARDELPERLEIVGPGDELFFLTPRLNEFPILDPRGDVLIPAQYAYSDEWGMIPASALGGKGGDGDIVVASAPIHVDRAGNVVRISHDRPDTPKPAKLNRYGNVDEWGHLLTDFHPHGGRPELDFEAQDIAARDIAARKATLSGEVGNPDFVSGVFGHAWGGTPEGDFWFKTIGARDGITTTELVYNRQSVEGNIKYFTDGISVGGVLDTARLTDEQGRQLTDHHRIDLLMPLGDGLYYISPRSDDGDTAIPFHTDDILIGYFRHDGVLPTATYLRVVSVFPSGFVGRLIDGLPPKEYMVLARRGNYSDPARQNSAYVDGKAGKMVFLRGVKDTAIRPENNAVQVGFIGDIVDPDFPDMTLEEVGIYGRNARLKGDFILRSGKNVAGEFERVDAELVITGEKIESSVSAVNARLDQAETRIAQTAQAISLKAESSTVDAMGERITQAEASIRVTSEAITQTVRKGDVISSINQSAEEVKIEASRIRLVGDTTLEGLFSAGRIKAEYIDADNLVARKLSTGESGARIEINHEANVISIKNAAGEEIFKVGPYAGTGDDPYLRVGTSVRIGQSGIGTGRIHIGEDTIAFGGPSRLDLMTMEIRSPSGYDSPDPTTIWIQNLPAGRTTDANIQALKAGTIFIDTGQNSNNSCMLRIKV